jgi:hypothetical protein
MRIASIDRVEPTPLPAALPLHLEHEASAAAPILKLLVLIPVTLVLLVPFAMLAKSVAADGAVRALLASKPASLAQIGLALAAWAVMLVWPVKRLVDGLTQSRSVEIVPGLVAITDRGLLRTRTRLVRLDAYAGVIHHVRASLSGLRHELILAHPDRKSSILLAISDRIGPDEIERVSALLGHREVPSRTIYTLRRPVAVPAAPAEGMARAA